LPKAFVLKRIIQTLLLLVMVTGSVAANTYDIDTTRVREPERPGMTTAEKILYGPTKLLQLPFYTLRYTTRGLIWAGYESKPARQIIANILAERGPIEPAISFGGNSGPRVGLRFNFAGLFGTNDRFGAVGQYSWYAYQNYAARYEHPDMFGKGVGWAINGSYDKGRRELFLGVGNNTKPDTDAAFGRESFRVRTDVTMQATKWLKLIGGVAYESHNISDGDKDGDIDQLDSIQTVFGLQPEAFRKTRLWSADFGFRMDWRNSPGRTTRGGLLGLDVELVQGINENSDLKFVRIYGDWSQHFELFKKRVLVFRFMANSIDNTQDESDEAFPFYLLNTLGSEQGLRGYRPDRFLGREAALASVEYRYPIWLALDGLVFFEEGRVFSSFTHDFTFEHWRYSTGFGIRMVGRYGEIARTILAFSDEGMRFDFSMGMEF